MSLNVETNDLSWVAHALLKYFGNLHWAQELARRGRRRLSSVWCLKVGCPGQFTRYGAGGISGAFNGSGGTFNRVAAHRVRG